MSRGAGVLHDPVLMVAAITDLGMGDVLLSFTRYGGGRTLATVLTAREMVASLQVGSMVELTLTPRGVTVNGPPVRLTDPRGEVTVTTDEAGNCAAVTRTDDEHRILSVIWERAAQSPARHAAGLSPAALFSAPHPSDEERN